MTMFVYILLGLIALSHCKAINTKDAVELGEQGKKTSMNFLIELELVQLYSSAPPDFIASILPDVHKNLR